MDIVVKKFLERQAQDALRLRSDLVNIVPFDAGDPPQAYLARFHCRGLVRTSAGDIVESNGPFVVGIRFPLDYLRQVEPVQIACWLEPFNVFHPNIRPPGICLGKIKPGTELIALVHQIYEIITLVNYAAHDALNDEAAEYTRKNSARFPLDRRPLRFQNPKQIQEQ